MRSSSGAHFIALDHVRALAVFMVFSWHFLHTINGTPISFKYVPALFPFSLLDEGHTGVALFMTLSGYLFAKLLDGKTIRYAGFIWNRILRLIPLLAVVILMDGIKQVMRGVDPFSYTRYIAKAVVSPILLPNGGWSITVEFCFYLILPLFLWMLAKSKFLPVSIIVGAIALRTLLFVDKGEIQSLAFWTIVGRMDQFVCGMLVYHFRSHFARRHFLAIGILTGFALFYWYFDAQGGFYFNPRYPSHRPFWIFFPTIEGIAYAVGIAWYEGSFTHRTAGLSRFIGRIGEYSYSIYLFHFFIVFHCAEFVHARIMNISNFYVALLWALVCFLFMMPVGYLSFRFIERPFLNLRKRYVVDKVKTGS